MFGGEYCDSQVGEHFSLYGQVVLRFCTVEFISLLCLLCLCVYHWYAVNDVTDS